MTSKRTEDKAPKLYGNLKPSVPMILLRKAVPAARRQTPAVAPFKRYEWTTEHQAMTSEDRWIYGGPTWETVITHHRGQFWANGASACEVIVIEDMRAAGQPNRLVSLWTRSDGTLTADRTEAVTDRRRSHSEDSEAVTVAIRYHADRMLGRSA
jgi:hypothetical protein